MSNSTEPTKPRRRTSTAKTAKASKSTKATAKNTAAKSTAAKSGSKTTRARKTTASPVTAEQRYDMIAEAAYLIAESHGFDSSRSLDDWLEAEAQIDAKLIGSTKH